MSEPTFAEMQLMALKGMIQICRITIDRKERHLREPLGVFYAHKVSAVSQLLRFKRQVPDLVPESVEGLQEKLLQIEIDHERALAIEERKDKT